jgi:transposase
MASQELSPSKRGRIVMLRDLGYTYAQIRDITGVSRSGAWKTVQRNRVHHTRNSLPRSGRPKALSERAIRAIIREIRRNRFAPYTVIAQNLNGVTARQVRSVAINNGYRRRVARRKPFLTKSAVAKRVLWARENAKRDWTRVIWTDETNSEVGERPGPEYVTRLPREEFLADCIQPTFGSGRKKIMLWGCIAYNKKGPLVRLELPEMVGEKRGSGLNGAKYVEQVIMGPLKEFVEELKKERGGDIFVVEDGAPAHTSRVAKIARNEIGIKTMTHPPRSPDLNPIEPLWRTLKARVAKAAESRSTVEKLWKVAQHVWDEISVEDINSYTSTMDDRVKAVKKAKGWHTGF